MHIILLYRFRNFLWSIYVKVLKIIPKFLFSKFTLDVICSLKLRFLSTMIPMSFYGPLVKFHLEFRLPLLCNYQQECNCLYVDCDFFLVIKHHIFQFPDNISLNIV